MKSRRGIASVVGMVFAIIALTTTIAYISYSMGILNNYDQSVLVKNQQLTDVDKERFQITSVTVPSDNKLNVTVTNTGSLPIQFTKIWVQDTTQTDSVHSYVPINNFVSPGAVLTNIGQDISSSLNPMDSYLIKLVTSRGNVQTFTVSSANTVPLNIQLSAFPSSIPPGFKTELVMIITNNQTSTFVNVTPNIPNNSDPTDCNISPASPTKFQTLPPGGTAIFKWEVSTLSTSTSGTTCTFYFNNSNPPIQNGYPQSLSTQILINSIPFGSTTLAANVGTLTINYTSWQYTQGSGWVSDWSLKGGLPTGYMLNLTNNDPSRTFYLASETALIIFPAGTSSSSAGYIANSISPSATVTDYGCSSGDYCQSILPHHWAYIYLGADWPGIKASSTPQKTSAQSGPAAVYVLLLGKFVSSNGITLYAQNIPFIAINLQ